MLVEGDWIIDNDNKKLGYVLKTHDEYVTVKFGKSTVSGVKYEKISLAPIDLHKEDYLDMIELSLDTKDEGWFYYLQKKMEGV